MTVIGKHAKKPMILESPVYVSHMSFGALSKEIKVARLRIDTVLQIPLDPARRDLDADRSAERLRDGKDRDVQR